VRTFGLQPPPVRLAACRWSPSVRQPFVGQLHVPYLQSGADVRLWPAGQRSRRRDPMLEAPGFRSPPYLSLEYLSVVPAEVLAPRVELSINPAAADLGRRPP
jgi:hypothetical protein